MSTPHHAAALEELRRCRELLAGELTASARGEVLATLERILAKRRRIPPDVEARDRRTVERYVRAQIERYGERATQRAMCRELEHCEPQISKHRIRSYVKSWCATSKWHSEI